MKRVLITGAGRGLGLGFTEQCLSHGYEVFAGVRNIQKATNLQKITAQNPDRLTIVDLDVTNFHSIDESYRFISERVNKIDLLINNAGVNSKSDGMDNVKSSQLGQLDAKAMLDIFHVNAIGPIMLAQRYIDLLKAETNSKIINISSDRGSITQKDKGGNYSYCASKAALNMLTRTIAFDVIKYKIIAVTIHPGYVKTDMSLDGSLSPSESAKAILKTVSNLKEEDTGKFLDYNGSVFPW